MNVDTVFTSMELYKLGAIVRRINPDTQEKAKGQHWPGGLFYGFILWLAIVGERHYTIDEVLREKGTPGRIRRRLKISL